MAGLGRLLVPFWREKALRSVAGTARSSAALDNRRGEAENCGKKTIVETCLHCSLRFDETEKNGLSCRMISYDMYYSIVLASQ